MTESVSESLAGSGVSFAAYALMMGLFSDRYFRLLNKAKGGILDFLRPFIFAVGWQVTTLIVAIGYRASASVVGSRVEVTWFVVWAFMFVYALADVVALTRNVSMHGLTRANEVAAQDNE